MLDERIYLDNQSTTPTDPKVVEAMMPYFSEMFGNPHSDAHTYGWQTHEAVDRSRKQVARLLNADKNEIIFTSGATESVNLALQGIARNAPKERNKIVTATTEHPCVLQCCEYLASVGFEIVELPVQEDGLLNLKDVKHEIDDRTLLVSIMLANNEIGVIQPISKISEICKAKGVILHTDATQSVGKMLVDVDSLGVDLLSLSAHKFYGPNGIGVLYLRKGMEKRMSPIIHGGGQERAIRSGTLPTPLIVGLGTACQITQEHWQEDSKHILNLQEKLLMKLKESIPDLLIFGSQTERIPGNLNIGFPNLSGDELISMVGDKLAISTGSACSSVTAEPSHVLQSLGLSNTIANSGIRVSIGRFNTEEEINLAAKWLIQASGR